MVQDSFNVVCGLILYTFKDTYLDSNGQVADKFFLLPSQNCGKNNFYVEIEDAISLFDFFELNLEFENGKMKSFTTEQMDGKSLMSCFWG